MVGNQKKCPEGKVLNPETGRCVKINGKIGRKLVDKQCPEGKILNKNTGRCVKIDGKVGKIISKIVTIVFEPSLSILANSSFDSGRSKSSTKRKNIWPSIDINRYLKWYSTFNTKIAKLFLKNNMLFVGYGVYKNQYMVLQFRTLDSDELLLGLQSATKSPPILKEGLKETLEAVKYALSPDPYEENLVVFEDKIHLIECIEIISVAVK